MSYKHYAVTEAAHIELSKAFVSAIKRMDSDVVARRLAALLNSRNTSMTFEHVVGEFLSIESHETSAD